MNKDTVIGIVGAVVLLAAMVGIFQYEGSQAGTAIGGGAFDVTWSESPANGPTASGATALGESSEEVVEINQMNLTKAQFTLVWEDEVNRASTFEFTVTPPSGSGLEPQTVAGDGGEVQIVFDVPNDVPETASVYARSESEAHANLAAENSADRGVGVWTVTVHHQEASGGLPGLPPVGDTEVAWEARTILTSYHPELTEQ